MNKRISARSIIIEDGNVYTMFRRRLKEEGTFKEYYVIPGGGIENNEELTECALREIKEELSVDIKIIGYLGKIENEETIAHFFHSEIISGIPTLGGEELEKCSKNNYYEIKLIPIKDINNLDIMAKDMILKAYNKIK
ncbi:MAG: NUDIX domain-containing protein [Bacilli bacterium]|nr:NUDIX domain-containing protein [Bacilli bacterium]